MSFIKNLENRTFSYRFSIENKDDEDLISLKKNIKDWNKNHPTNKKRISLMARGPRRNNSYNTLHKDARYFDVYVHSVVNWENWQLKRRRELEIQDEFVEGIKNELWNFMNSRGYGHPRIL